MVRKNKGKKKKGSGRTKAADKVNDDSSLIRIRNVWPQLDKNGCWTCTNCKSLNSMINCPEPGGCYDCGHDELDEKFAVLIIPILMQLHEAGLLCGKKSTHVSVDDRTTWKPSVVLDACNSYLETTDNVSIVLDKQLNQLFRLIKVRSLIYEEDSGPEEVALAVRIITMDFQNDEDEYMTEIAKTTEFHTLVNCVQHYHDQKSKAASSSENNNNEVSRTIDDEKLRSNTEENVQEW